MESFAPSRPPVELRRFQITAENYTWLLTWNILNWRVFFLQVWHSVCMFCFCLFFSPQRTDIFFEPIYLKIDILHKHLTKESWEKVPTPCYFQISKFYGEGLTNKIVKKMTCGVKITHLIIVGGSSLSTICLIYTGLTHPPSQTRTS